MGRRNKKLKDIGNQKEIISYIEKRDISRARQILKDDYGVPINTFINDYWGYSNYYESGYTPCPGCKRPHCTIMPGIKGNELILNNLLAPSKYADEIKAFFRNYIDSFTKARSICEEAEKRNSSGNRKITPNAFTAGFKELVQSVIGKEAKAEQGSIRETYANFFPKKRVDFVIEKGGSGPRVFCEFKGCLNNNSFGEAFFESVLIDKKPGDKFFIVTSSILETSLTEIIKNKPFSDYIDRIFSFSPAINEDFNPADMISFLDELKKIFPSNDTSAS